MVSIIISNRARATQTSRNHHHFASSRKKQICALVKCHWCSVYVLLALNTGGPVGILVVVADGEEKRGRMYCKNAHHADDTTV